MPNLCTGHFGETTLIRLLVRLGAEPHSPVASSDKSQGAAAVVALVRGHCLLLYDATNKSMRTVGSSARHWNAVDVVNCVQIHGVPDWSALRSYSGSR